MSDATLGTDLIGSFHDTRYACADSVHVLTCYNPLLDQTWCQCGETRLGGGHTVMRERFLWSSAGQGARLVGYDRYVLGACSCHAEPIVAVGAREDRREAVGG